MNTIRKGLREGELEKDTYERVVCIECEKPLRPHDDSDPISTIRACPDCGTKWKELR